MRSNLLTSSRLKTARKCKREHRIKYELGYRPVHDADELFFGILVHLALEAWWLAQKNGQGLVALELALSRLRAAICDPFDRARAEAMMCGYDTRWADEAARYEVLGVELKFRTVVINPETNAESRTWELGGKLDVLLRERTTGRVVIMEHKTSSEDVSQGSTYWRKLRMDGQISIYFDGAASLGFGDVDRCLYDVLGKPQHRPSQVSILDGEGLKIVLDAQGQRVRTKTNTWRQTPDKAEGWVLQTREETPLEYRDRCEAAIAENPDKYFSRGEVVRLEAELADSRADIWALGKELREGELAGRAQRNPDACQRNSSMCSFFDVCTGAASLDDPRLFTHEHNVHPELAGEPQPSESPKEVGAT